MQIHTYSVWSIKLGVKLLQTDEDVSRSSTFCNPLVVPRWHLCFAAIINEMLDRMEIVFKRLNKFNLRIKPKKCHFFQHDIVFLRHVLAGDSISPNPEKNL